MEASARASLNFLEQLYIFHRQQGSMNKIAVPSVNGKPVDLWKLKRAVADEGGYTEASLSSLLSSKRANRAGS